MPAPIIILTLISTAEKKEILELFMTIPMIKSTNKKNRQTNIKNKKLNKKHELLEFLFLKKRSNKFLSKDFMKEINQKTQTLCALFQPHNG